VLFLVILTFDGYIVTVRFSGVKNMALIPYDPFRSLENWRREMEKFFDEGRRILFNVKNNQNIRCLNGFTKEKLNG